MYGLVPSPRASVGGADLDRTCTARYTDGRPDPADQLHPSRCIPIRWHYHPASTIATSGHALQASVPAAWCGGDHPLEHRLGFPDSHRNRHSVGRRPPLL